MRARARHVLAPLLLAALATGCASRNLDTDQQAVEARECASLLERHVARREPTGLINVDGKVIDLGADPDAFYSVLEQERGPDDFPLVGGKAATETRAGFVSDLCKAKDASRPKLGASTTTTTTTSSTVPVPGG